MNSSAFLCEHWRQWTILLVYVLVIIRWGRHGHGRMVVRFTTTYAISVYHYYRHDIAEILLKVALKTLTLTHNKVLE